MGYAMSTQYTPWYMYDMICGGVYNNHIACYMARSWDFLLVMEYVLVYTTSTRRTGQLVPWLTKPTD